MQRTDIPKVTRPLRVRAKISNTANWPWHSTTQRSPLSFSCVASAHRLWPLLPSHQMSHRPLSRQRTLRKMFSSILPTLSCFIGSDETFVTTTAIATIVSKLKTFAYKADIFLFKVNTGASYASSESSKAKIPQASWQQGTGGRPLLQGCLSHISRRLLRNLHSHLHPSTRHCVWLYLLCVLTAS